MDSLNCLSYESIKLLNKNRLLLSLIKAEVVKKELSTICIEDKEKTKQIEAFKIKYGLTKSEDLNNWMKANSYENEDMEHICLSELRIKKYCQKNLSHKVESHFLKRKSDLDIIIYSLIRLNNLDLANELYLQIVEKEEEFGELSSKYSLGIEQKSRGIVGPSSLGGIHPKLKKHLLKSPLRETQPPIEVEGTYLIVRVESLDSAQIDDFMKIKMSEEIFFLMIESKAKNIFQMLIENHESKSKKEVILGNI